MIIPMIKYTLLIYHRGYDELLEGLGKLGVFHVNEKYRGQDISVNEIQQKISDIEETIEFLIELPKKERKKLPPLNVATNNASAALEHIDNIRHQLEELRLQESLLKKEIKTAPPWAKLTRELLDKLNEEGDLPHCFICHADHFNPTWKRKYKLHIVNQDADMIYFLVKAQPSEIIDIDAEEIKSLKYTLDELLFQQTELNEKLTELETQLYSISNLTLPLLIKKKQELADQLLVKTVELNTDDTCEGRLLILEGYVPEYKANELEKLLKHHDVHCLKKEATSEETPPVLLNNSKIPALFEPITKLFSLPSYRDADLTPFFAPFFLLFFGFCLGDAIYGLIILLSATVLKKVKKYQEYTPLFSLAQLFGLAAIIVGTATGTFLGVNHDGLDLGKYHSLFLNQQQLFNLALAIGIIQILFGLALQAFQLIHRKGFIYGLSPIGWIVVILGILDSVLFEVVPTISENAIYGGVALIVLFAAPEMGIFKGLGKGIWSLYGITGLFGDVLSYIRLFALGVSSSILGLVVNSIALEFLNVSYIGWLLFALFMIIGHGLNLAIASLGAFVHPLRLTFVEFYKNAGFEGGGKEYKPFSINNLKN